MNSNLTLIAGFVLTLIAMLIAMPAFIRYLKNRNVNQVTSEYALEEFKNKEKTPIMGGLLFVIIPIIVSINTTKMAINLLLVLNGNNCFNPMITRDIIITDIMVILNCFNVSL